MDRLTTKWKTNRGFEYCFNGNSSFNHKELNKLGELEDFEEGLGVNLVTLSKALKNGIYVKYSSKSIGYIEPSNLNISLRKNDFDDGIYFVIQELYFEDLDGVMDTTGEQWSLKDYGKKWSLDKEELINQ